MTLANIFSQMGDAPKQLIDRYAEYPAPVHEQVYYPYEPAPQTQVVSSKHHYNGKGSHKSNAALSALTLLAFLFFLHILQQCLRDHMAAMNTPQVMIMSSSREGEENVGKTSNNKIDKSGKTEDKHDYVSNKYYKNTGNTEQYSAVASGNNDKYLTKLSTSEYTPKNGVERYKQVLDLYGNQSPKGADFDKKYR